MAGGRNNPGSDMVIKADPTASNTRNGTGFTSGCRSITAPQLEQTGRAPLGGCSTTAGPQQHSRQRNRGMGGWREARSADQLIATIMLRKVDFRKPPVTNDSYCSGMSSQSLASRLKVVKGL